MAGRLSGKVAVVTGSGQSIGRAIAMLLAQEGAKVVTNNRSPHSPDGTAATVAKEINDGGGKAVPVFADVSTMEGGRKLIQACLDAFGTIDILVNNAGGGLANPIHTMTEEQWDANINVNLKGQFTCTKFAAPVLKEKGWGRIINVSSRVGLHGLAGMCAYAAAKAGVMGFTLALSHELGKEGITVNCIVPTANTVRAERTRQARTAVTGRPIPASPNRTPEHVAPMAVYLATDEAAGINGQIFYTAAGEITLYAGPTPARTVLRPGKWTLDELCTLFPNIFGTRLTASLPPFPPT